MPGMDGTGPMGHGRGMGQARGGDLGGGRLRGGCGAKSSVGAPVCPTTYRPATVDDASLVARLDDRGLCTACGICAHACPSSAIGLDVCASVDGQLCTGCGKCVDACPSGLLALVAA